MATLTKMIYPLVDPSLCLVFLAKFLIFFTIVNYFANLCTSDYQYGFKKRHSTNHCTFAVKEVISYYCNNRSNVFSCALDMQKAFDKVNLVVLLKKLISRDIPLHMIRVLFDLYYILSLSVLWHGCKSKQFISYNGVKQGGVLSAILFCIYINDLLIGLEKQGYDCFIGKLCYGVLAYANDIILLAPSLSALITRSCITLY